MVCYTKFNCNKTHRFFVHFILQAENRHKNQTWQSNYQIEVVTCQNRWFNCNSNQQEAEVKVCKQQFDSSLFRLFGEITWVRSDISANICWICLSAVIICPTVDLKFGYTVAHDSYLTAIMTSHYQSVDIGSHYLWSSSKKRPVFFVFFFTIRFFVLAVSRLIWVNQDPHFGFIQCFCNL